VEGEPVWLAAERHHLVHGGNSGILCCDRPSRRIRAEGQIVGKGHTPCGSRHGGLNMQFTEIHNPSNQRGLSQSLPEHCFRQLISWSGRSESWPHGTLRLISRQEAERRHPWGACLSGHTNDDSASHTGGVRENRWRRRLRKSGLTVRNRRV
jgi:hypothetical protein